MQIETIKNNGCTNTKPLDVKTTTKCYEIKKSFYNHESVNLS